MDTIANWERTHYPFIPPGLRGDSDMTQLELMTPADHDDPETYVDEFGSALVLTNIVLPIPPPLLGARPEWLSLTIISWMYSIMFPAAILSGAERFQFVSMDTPALDTPLDMDATHTDDWIMREIATEACKTVSSIRGQVKRRDISKPGSKALVSKWVRKYPWCKPSVEVELPKIGRVHEWLAKTRKSDG